VPNFGQFCGVRHTAPPVARAPLRTKLDAAGWKYVVEKTFSIYFRDPDGVRFEQLARPLDEPYEMTFLAGDPKDYSSRRSGPAGYHRRPGWRVSALRPKTTASPTRTVTARNAMTTNMAKTSH
jgi:hypothetical protein